MKKFVSENWYKLMIGSSMLMGSFGFMVHSVSPAYAEESYLKENDDELAEGVWVEYDGYAYAILYNYDNYFEVVRKVKLEVGERATYKDGSN
jgi:hypothetical protein